MVHCRDMTTTTRRITGTDAIEAAVNNDAITLHKYADPTEGERHGLTVDEARQIAREDAGLIWADVADYTEYTVRISTEPSYYGSECTEADVDRITERLANIIRDEFPGVRVELKKRSEEVASLKAQNAELLEELRSVASLTVPQSTALKAVWISHGRKWSDALIQARSAIAKATGGERE